MYTHDITYVYFNYVLITYATWYDLPNLRYISYMTEHSYLKDDVFFPKLNDNSSHHFSMICELFVSKLYFESLVRNESCVIANLTVNPLRATLTLWYGTVHWWLHGLELMATDQAAAGFDEQSVRIWCLSKQKHIWARSRRPRWSSCFCHQGQPYIYKRTVYWVDVDRAISSANSNKAGTVSIVLVLEVPFDIY